MDNKVFLVIVVAVVVGLLAISYYKTNGNDIDDTEVIQCIANKAKLYVSTGCYACARQKEILGDNIQYFDIIDCAVNPEECKGITGVPTWLINGEMQLGVRSIDKLKELTGC